MFRYPATLLFFILILISNSQNKVEINTIDSPPFEQTALVAIQYGAISAIQFYQENFRSDEVTKNISLLNTTADILISVGKRQEAETILSFTLSEYPNEIDLIINRAIYFAKLGQYIKAAKFYSDALRNAERDSSAAELKNKIKNRLAFANNIKTYSSYSGAYELENGQLLIFKFDPYVGTYPVFLNMDTGLYKILYPLSSDEFFYKGEEGEKHKVVFSGKSISLHVQNGEIISGVKISTTWESLKVTSSGRKINGDLILPSGEGPHPLVILVHGSGYSTRYNLYIEAYNFAAHGYAAFVYDKQGTGLSDGEIPLEASFESLSDDVVAVINQLRSVNKIDKNKIGLWGHSEGGWIVPIAASKSDEVRFVILSSPAAVNPFEQTKQSNLFAMKNDGLPDSIIAAANNYMTSLSDALDNGKSLAQIEELILSAKNSDWGNYALTPRSDWELGLWRELNKNEPGNYLTQLNIPVLVLYGLEDRNVIVSKNLPLIKKYLSQGESNFNIVEIPEANHQFMLPDNNYSTEYFSAMIKWLESKSPLK